MGIMSCVVSAGSVILQYGINGLGTLIIAGHTAARKVFFFIATPFGTSAAAVQTFVSQNKGANQINRIKKAMKSVYVFDIIATLIIAISMFLFADGMIQIISGSTDPVVLESGAKYLKLSTPFYVFLGILLQTRYALQGIGEKLLPLISSFIEFVCKVLFVIFLIPRFQFMAIIFCEPVAWTAMAIQLVFAFWKNPVIQKRL